MKSLFNYFLAIYLTFFLFSCNNKSGNKEANSKPKIVCTTGMIADILKNIGDTTLVVESLMGPGVDPHLYKASQGDLQKLIKSDLIFYNGLHLEGKMGEVFEKMSRTKPVVAVSDKISSSLLRHVEGSTESHDPHIWFDVSLWTEAVRNVRDTLKGAFPEKADLYEVNASAYIKKLDSLHTRVLKDIESIPSEQRILVTAHDAFGYFGDAYDIEVRGLQGISTTAEFGLKDITELVSFITKKKIKAVFVESSVSEKALHAVKEGCRKKGWNVNIGGMLYSDSMGGEGTMEGTYIGMVETNVKTIVAALR